MSKFKQMLRVLIFSGGISLISANLYAQYGPYDIATASGTYDFSYTQSPGNLIPVNASNTGSSYEWQQSYTPLFENYTVVASTASYTAPLLTQTTYYRRVTNIGNPIIATETSNVIRLQLVSQNWEDLNYVREHDVLVPGETDWEAIDQLPIGSKLQTTTYTDGLGRPVEKVSRETATPATGNLWGDVVQFSQYDAYGRQPNVYLPYTTTTESGKFKSAPATEQPQYYSTNYNETYPYYQNTYDNSPLNRVTNTKSPGTSWAAGSGNSTAYELNDVSENVQQFTIGYNSGDYPVSIGAYPSNTLLKTTHTDENGKEVIQYVNSLGQIILTKTQVDDNPSTAHSGWACVYNVYDDFGLLRYVIQPEAVNYLDNNGWTFDGTNGAAALDGECFRYDYDAKGRTILKKAPGAKALNMMYDSRDRIVFMQDGNQSDKTPNPEWTANIYDDLDRLVMVTLYKTNQTIPELQSDIDNATTTTVSTSVVQPVKDLVVDSRDPSITTYSAQNSIEFVPGFSSNTNDNFVAEIDANASQSTNVTNTAYNSPISNTDLNDPNLNTIVKYLFYDDYSFEGAKSFDNNFNNTAAYSNGDPNVLTIAPTQRTLSVPTGSMVRVLGTSTFLTSTEYYDEKGHHIQSIENNIKSGTDVTTYQYGWDGRMLSIDEIHTTANSGYADYDVLTKNIFDNIGRITSIMKKFGDNDFKTIASYDLDDMGRLRTKHLDPDYTPPQGGSGLESLDYTYNIQNEITGINKDYALKTSGQYDKWGHYFGMYLGYDNRDGVFNAPKLDGHVTGILWNTQGDDNQRKYDYTYDDAGRLIKADFREYSDPSGGSQPSWNNSKLDFSVGGNGTNSTIEYDLNGNLISLNRNGIVIGGTGPIAVDELQYEYKSYSNLLTKVTDNSTDLGTNNGALGDFKDGTNSGSDDYAYDDNGNMIVDLNKNAVNATGGQSTSLGNAGITYNFLDKPEIIHITGKGTIQIVYDADGNKLQRLYTPEGSNITTTTTYVNEFVYQGTSNSGGTSNETLSYINFEEGRIRVITPFAQNNGYDGVSIDGNMNLPDGRKGVYDYFIRDYQQNVRMILTEETHTGLNECTMETSRASDEEPIFGQQGSANEVSSTRTDKPSGWTSNSSAKVSELSKLTGHIIGPNTLLKVMAGDEITTKADYYYPQSVTNNNNSMVSDIVGALVTAITGSSATPQIVHGNTGNISNDLNSSVPFAEVADPGQGTGGNTPRAYLNVLFFNERFEFVQESSTALRVSVAGDGTHTLELDGIKAPKNGYVYVYLSNENDDPVYFDNFIVQDDRGRIIEEDHYYPYGLKIAGISSVKFADANEGVIANKYLYNDKELFDDGGLNWYDYRLRNFDPQLGRWVQQDPYFQHASPYIGMGNDPINNIDKNGGWSAGLTGAVIGAAVGFIAPYAIQLITGHKIHDKGLLGAGGAILGAGLGYAAFESIANQATSAVGTLAYDGGHNGSTRFFANFKAFYSGLVGSDAASHIDLIKHPGSAMEFATPPNLWGWMKHIHFNFVKVLPKINFYNPAKGRDEVSDFGFIWRIMLSFNPPVIPGYLLLREILQIPIPHRR